LRLATVQHKFVEFIPSQLEQGVVYISGEYRTAVHLCADGCGNKVVTPISPVDWQLMFDGETVSLTPSIGNWDFPCRSHYWIKNDLIEWADALSAEKIEAALQHDLEKKKVTHVSFLGRLKCWFKR